MPLESSSAFLRLLNTSTLALADNSVIATGYNVPATVFTNQSILVPAYP